jgi:hypothetical protein
MKLFELICVLSLVTQIQNTAAAPMAAINKLAVPTNAIIRTQINPPASPAEFIQSNSPDYDTNSSFLALSGGGAVPDTHGAVGPNHVMTTLNTQVRIQNRGGTSNFFTSTLTAFWTNSGFVLGAFDPRITFDSFKQRWIATAQDRHSSSSNFILLATSMTSDPTGFWNFRQYQVESANLADHPVLGFNQNWIVVTINVFPPGGVPGHSQIYAFDKQSLYASNAPAPIVFTNAGPGLGICPVTSYDTNATNMFLVQDYNGSTTNLGNSNLMGYLRLFELRGSVAAPELITNLPLVATSQTWTNAGGNFSLDNFAPQLGTSQKLHTFDSRFASAVYRSGSIWCTHTIFLPATNATRSSIQWWQIRTNGTVVQRGLIDDPGGTNFYAFPSIGVNRFHDALIGYSRFSSNQYASANYSFRAFYDAASTLRKDRVLKAGESFYVIRPDGLNRWGDYSATIVDPVNGIDLWTIQEYAAMHANTGLEADDGRWGTWWGKINPPVPANDVFSSPQTISGGAGSATNTTHRALKETGEPHHGGNAGGSSVWYNWTAPNSGQAVIDTIGSDFNTLLGVYTGAAVTNLSLVASNDNVGSALTNRVIFDAVSNTVYRIALDGYNGDSGTGIVSWCQSFAPVIVSQPESTNVVANANENATFSVLACGIPSPLTYQWRFHTNSPGTGNEHRGRDEQFLHDQQRAGNQCGQLFGGHNQQLGISDEQRCFVDCARGFRRAVELVGS